MRIKIEGKWVCSLCGEIWETYHGLDGREPAQCASCGARPDDDDLPYDSHSGAMGDLDG